MRFSVFIDLSEPGNRWEGLKVICQFITRPEIGYDETQFYQSRGCKMTRHRNIACLITACCLLSAACSTTIDRQDEPPIVSTEDTTLAAPAASNVILFIGDGMGISTVTAIRILDGQEKGMTGEENVLPFELFPHVALSKTYETNQQVGESAGTATAMLTGRKTKAGFIGVGSAAVRADCASSTGHSLQSALELSEIIGLATGIVTTTRLNARHTRIPAMRMYRNGIGRATRL